MQSFDLWAFYWLHHFAGNSFWTDAALIFFAQYLLYISLLLVAFTMYADFTKNRIRRVYNYAAAVVGALVARFGVAVVIDHFYHRVRPYVALHVPHLLSESSYSFPSQHTIFMFALATGVMFINRRLAWWLYAFGFLIGVARVSAGVHYPTDILGGIILGILTGYICYKIWESIRHVVHIPYV